MQWMSVYACTHLLPHTTVACQFDTLIAIAEANGWHKAHYRPHAPDLARSLCASRAALTAMPTDRNTEGSASTRNVDDKCVDC